MLDYGPTGLVPGQSASERKHLEVTFDADHKNPIILVWSLQRADVEGVLTKSEISFQRLSPSAGHEILMLSNSDDGRERLTFTNSFARLESHNL